MHIFTNTLSDELHWNGTDLICLEDVSHSTSFIYFYLKYSRRKRVQPRRVIQSPPNTLLPY